MAGSAAGEKVAWPKPSQTGVEALKVWVRSTNLLFEMMRQASANESWSVVFASLGVAQPARTAANAVMYATTYDADRLFTKP